MSRPTEYTVAAAALLAAVLPSSVAFAGHGGGYRGHRGISVMNERAESVQVVIDGELVGMLPAGARASFPANEGRHGVVLQDDDGDIILKTRVSVRDGERARVRAAAGDGTLHLVNDSGVNQIVSVTDRAGELQRQALPSGGSADFLVTPGEVHIATTGTWYGGRMLLAEETYLVEPLEVESDSLPKIEAALVRVDNMSGEPVELYVGGERLGMVGAESVGRVRVPIGTHEVTMMVDGMQAGTRTLTVTEQAGGRLSFSSARTHLTVQNDSRLPGSVLVDGRMMGRLMPGEATNLSVFTGTHNVEFVVHGGRVLDSDELQLRSRAGFRWVVTPPSTVAQAPRPARPAPRHHEREERHERHDRD